MWAVPNGVEVWLTRARVGLASRQPDFLPWASFHSDARLVHARLVDARLVNWALVDAILVRTFWSLAKRGGCETGRLRDGAMLDIERVGPAEPAGRRGNSSSAGGLWPRAGCGLRF